MARLHGRDWTKRELLRREGRLPFLAPGETKRYHLEFRILADPKAIQAVELEILGQQEN